MPGNQNSVACQAVVRWHPTACETMKKMLVASQDLDHKWWRTGASLTEGEAVVMQAHLESSNTTVLADGVPAAFVSFTRGAQWIKADFPDEQCVPGPAHAISYTPGGYYVHSISELQVRHLPQATRKAEGFS